LKFFKVCHIIIKIKFKKKKKKFFFFLKNIYYYLHTSKTQDRWLGCNFARE
jgi:hypothetical protein